MEYQKIIEYKMEFQKIINLLDYEVIQPCRFRTKS